MVGGGRFHVVRRVNCMGTRKEHTSEIYILSREQKSSKYENIDFLLSFRHSLTSAAMDAD